MYCVQCGTQLNDGNQVGLVCARCKCRRRETRREGDLPVSVQFCYQCGQAFHPTDAAVHHLSCFSGDMMTGRVFVHSS